jgi:uncharacterized protein YdeI (BOF family)
MKTHHKKSAFLLLFVAATILFWNNAISQNNPTENETVKIAALQSYTTAYIIGTVVKILDEDEFRLKDASGKIKVYTGWKNTNLVKKGDIITVKGSLDPGFIKEFYATQIIKEDGQIIELQGD